MSDYIESARALSNNERAAREASVEARIAELSSFDKLSGPQTSELSELRKELATLMVVRSEARQALLTNGSHRTVNGSVDGNEDPTLMGGGSVRDQALRVLDRGVRDGSLPSYAAEKVEGVLRSEDHGQRTDAARWAVVTGAEAYRSAFAKLVSNPTQGHLEWTPAEQDAYRAVQTFRSETRAMAGTSGAAGSYMVPLHLDPSIMISSSGSINALRQISRTAQIAGPSWNGVTSAGVTAAWYAEGAERSDASPTLAQPTVPVFSGSAFIPFSREVGDDAVSFAQELTKLLVDGAVQLQNTAFTTGSGSAQPTGLVTKLAATAGSKVNTAAAHAIATSDIYGLQAALPPRFQGNATFSMSLPLINELRQLETTNGAPEFPELRSTTPSLLGRAVNEISNMDSDLSNGGNMIVYGDHQQFLIVDRLGSEVELIPHLFGSSQRPTGQRGLFLNFRCGSDVLVPEAFRLLVSAAV